MSDSPKKENFQRQLSQLGVVSISFKPEVSRKTPSLFRISDSFSTCLALGALGLDL